jgi:CO/xanthine dehydrogenase Mo-binding subunit
MSFGSTIVELSVDDETGIVSIDGLYNCYDMGTVINPLLAEGQVDGGGMQGIGMGLYEDLQPYKAGTPDLKAANFTDYIIPTFSDLPKKSATEFFENYDPYGPYGAKGCGEMVTNTQAPAIINAIHDAVGIWVDELPATPERILKLIDEKK